MNKQPIWYKDWRDLWHKECRILGMYLCYDSNFQDNKIKWNKSLWKQLNRVHRIRKRLDIETQVKDSTFWDAMAEMLLREFGR